MHRFKIILVFSLPYLRRYWHVMTLGLLCGTLYGVSNGGVVWLTKTVLSRISAPAQESRTAAPVAVTLGPDAKDATLYLRMRSWMGQKRREVQRWGAATVDPWLPHAGKPFDRYQLISIALFLPLLSMIRSISQFVSKYALAWAGEHIINDLRVDVFATLNRLSLDYFNKSTLGDMITRINGDTKMLQRSLSFGIEHSVQDPITLISVLTVLFFIDWQMMLVMMLVTPLMLLPVATLSRQAKKAGVKMVDTTVVQSSMIIETLSGIRVVQAFNLENLQVERFAALSRRLVKQTMKGIRAKELVSPIVESVSVLAVCGLLIYVIASERHFADVMAFFMGLILLYMPVKKLARLHVLFQNTSVGVERLRQVLAEKPTVVDRPDASRIQGFSRELKLEAVHFAYGETPVLKNIDLVVRRGLKLGLAGESGSGKSTIINLVLRFIDPCSGRVVLDGKDYRDLSLRDLRDQMALVSQDIVLFDQTIAENIASGRSGSPATRGEIEEAARNAFAHGFIMALPDQYDARIGERGVKLSGGQRQRLAIARAFVRDAPILVLDEATAALDSHSEAEVQGAIDRLAEDRTVICVAHRLSTLARMDEIVVLARGEIVERGSYRQLLDSDGPFSRMAAKQGIFGKGQSPAASVH